MAYWETEDGWIKHTPLHVREGAAGQWEPWFAWRPVRMSTRGDDGWAWLSIVERRWFYPAPWFCPPAPFRYREYRRLTPSSPKGGDA